MASQGDSSSSSSTDPCAFDVFLSSRDEYSLNKFTDHLYYALFKEGIKVYIDHELKLRGEISPVLCKAIEKSKVSIIVLSKLYVSSMSCLDELVKILECKDTKQQLVLPVFYDVQPSEVRHQRWSVGDALSELEQSFKDGMKLQRWKAALKAVANLPGFDLGDRDEFQLIRKIVQFVSGKLIVKPTYLKVAKDPIGIQPHVQAINSLLAVEMPDTRMIGIFGVGGTGKTTIAKAIYNLIASKFEGCCFLANIREISKRECGIVQLQETLYSEILADSNLKLGNIHRRINVIKERLRCKRVLLVLDDVDQLDQLKTLSGELDWFGSGSRIIITTRDEHLLTQHGVHRTYEAQELDHKEALTDKPADDFVVTKDVLYHAEGVPLPLTGQGSDPFVFWQGVSPACLVLELEPSLVNSNDLHTQLLVSSMASQGDSSSSSSTDPCAFDVFLSSRDAYSLNEFTDHLYNALFKEGIKVYNHHKLRLRGEISPVLCKAIEKSKVSIIVLSKDYVSSMSCLDELVNILECKDAKQQLVLPVFYDVQPSEVRHQRWSVGAALSKLERSCKDGMKLQRWKAALKAVANLPGFDFGDRDESKLIHQIVRAVSRIVKPPYLKVAKDPIGIQRRVQAINSLLEVEMPDTRMNGIFGVGGIGKTTTAKAIYDLIAYNFEASCFLENIREISKRECGIVQLQEKLLSEILGKSNQVGNIDQGIKVIKDRLCCNRVLLILDDVDQLDQLKTLSGELDWFGSGSRIIITTRDKHLLTQHGVHRTYEAQELDHKEALTDKPADDFVETLYHAEVIPLALTGQGSDPFEPDKRNEDIRHLPEENTGTNEIEAKAEGNDIVRLNPVAFNSLPNDLIVLDWHGYHLSSLPSNFHPKRFMDLRMPISLIPDVRMEHANLSVLNLSSCELLTKVPNLSRQPNLKELILSFCTNLEEIHDSVGLLDKLVRLDLCHCSKLWSFPRSIKLRSLEHLELGGCSSLRNFPEIEGEMKNLYRISLYGSGIKELPSSIRNISELRWLDLTDCKNLMHLPDSILQLPQLKSLSMEGCPRFRGFGEKLIEDNRQFMAFIVPNRKYDISGGPSTNSNISNDDCYKEAAVRESEFLSPENLVLSESNCFTNSTWKPNLSKLVLSGTDIVNLPGSIKRFVRLRCLHLKNCKQLQEIPELPQKIEEVHARGCISLESFPQVSKKFQFDTSDDSIDKLIWLDLSRCAWCGD